MTVLPVLQSSIYPYPCVSWHVFYMSQSTARTLFFLGVFVAPWAAVSQLMPGSPSHACNSRVTDTVLQVGGVAFLDIFVFPQFSFNSGLSVTSKSEIFTQALIISILTGDSLSTSLPNSHLNWIEHSCFFRLRFSSQRFEFRNKLASP